MKYQCTQCLKVSEELPKWFDKLFQFNWMYCPYCGGEAFKMYEPLVAEVSE